MQRSQEGTYLDNKRGVKESNKKKCKKKITDKEKELALKDVNPIDEGRENDRGSGRESSAGALNVMPKFWQRGGKVLKARSGSR